MDNISARVVNEFNEEQHNNHHYKADDVYPAEGYEAKEERVYFLTGIHPKYKKIFLADVTEFKEPAENEESKNDLGVEKNDFPKHLGAGRYELSDGSKVKGKEEAIKAENALKSGD
ncbi:hypothetical protein [Metasolibacillus meyeri]|uniref:hypothetical protein n=1 Tax=Metasolibacillus meyeri TaxID=1071052 RepID=UPI000D310EF9|nr:hypothetical protein [Metasolibacillus meyeri]